MMAPLRCLALLLLVALARSAAATLAITNTTSATTNAAPLLQHACTDASQTFVVCVNVTHYTVQQCDAAAGSTTLLRNNTMSDTAGVACPPRFQCTGFGDAGLLPAGAGSCVSGLPSKETGTFPSSPSIHTQSRGDGSSAATIAREATIPTPAAAARIADAGADARAMMLAHLPHTVSFQTMYSVDASELALCQPGDPAADAAAGRLMCEALAATTALQPTFGHNFVNTWVTRPQDAPGTVFGCVYNDAAEWRACNANNSAKMVRVGMAGGWLVAGWLAGWRVVWWV